MATYTIAPERPDGTRADYVEHVPRTMFDKVGLSSSGPNTSTKLILAASSNNRLVINGTGLVVDKNASDQWISGTVSSVELWNATLSVQLAAITGLTIQLDVLGPQIANPGAGVLQLLLDGNDTVLGGKGNDRLRGLNGDDSMSGGAGDDLFTPGAGNDTIDGGEGFNGIEFWDYVPTAGSTRTIGIIINLASGSVVDPWGSRDYFKNIQQVTGTSLNDTLIGDAVGNLLTGSAGDDLIFGMEGDDNLRPDEGDDAVDGGSGWDTVTYEWAETHKGILADLQSGTVTDPWDYTDTLTSIERVRSTNYADSISGSTGDDTFQTLGGADTVSGGAGVDTVDYSRDSRWGGTSGVTVNLSTNSATDGLGDKDILNKIENVVGTQFADKMTGSGGANLLTGNAGNDNLGGGSGNDTLDGGTGSDILAGGADNDSYYLDNASDKVIETSSGGTADRVYTTVSHTLGSYVENLYASGTASISLTGNTSANVVYGNSGANRVDGGYGNDTLKGGTGKDAFTFSTKLSTSANRDTIVDFSVADDSIYLDNAIFTKLGSGTLSSPKKVSSSYFTVGSAAKDKNDYVIYNKTTGVLSYDADGSGSGRAVEVAKLSKNLLMTYSDIYIV